MNMAVQHDTGEMHKKRLEFLGLGEKQKALLKNLQPLVRASIGGALEADEMFLELEIAAEDQLRAGDRETTPEGELRWRYAARRARVALIDEGLMTKDRPGVWKLA